MTEPVDAVSSGDAGSKVQAQYDAYQAQMDQTDTKSTSKSEPKFDKSLGLNADQAKKFYSNMCNYLVTSSKTNEKHMKEASAELKKAETGKA